MKFLCVVYYFEGTFTCAVIFLGHIGESNIFAFNIHLIQRRLRNNSFAQSVKTRTHTDGFCLLSRVICTQSLLTAMFIYGAQFMIAYVQHIEHQLWQM